jgi:hypothetical protein
MHLLAVAKCHITQEINPQFQIKAYNSKEYLSWVATAIEAWEVLEAQNTIHVYCEVRRIPIPFA